LQKKREEKKNTMNLRMIKGILWTTIMIALLLMTTTTFNSIPMVYAETTTLTTAASSGATRIYVGSTSGFSKNDWIKIGTGDSAELRRITGIGTNYFDLHEALSRSHAIGESVKAQFEKFGPRVDNILFKVYATRDAEFTAFDTGQIDVIDWPLTKTLWDKYRTDANYVTNEMSLLDMYELDINNMKWPTSNVYFRRALAHLFNREKFYTDVLKSFSGILMDTLIPTGAGIDQYYNPNAAKYPYSPATAAAILDSAGFLLRPDGVRQDPTKPDDPHYPGYKYPLDPIKFYIRLDDPDRLEAGRWIDLELRKIGIPMATTEAVRPVCFAAVMQYPYAYNIYTGGWWLAADPDYIYDMYHSKFGKDWYPRSYAPNYVFFDNATFDYWAEQLKYAPDTATVMTAVMKVQEIFAEQVGVVPLWHSAGGLAYRKYYGTWTGETDYAGKPWNGMVNERGFGVNSWWTFFNAHPQDYPRGGTIRYGMMSDAEILNPVHSEWYWDWEVLNKVYDQLIRANPYDAAQDIPWMAKSYTVDTWDGGTKTKITFKLHKNMLWHDAAKPDDRDDFVTSYDVNFTMHYMKQAFATIWYAQVLDIDHIDIPGGDWWTVEVYFKVKSIFALHWVGSVPIIPKHIWQNIAPGVSREQGEYETTGRLTGSGPFKLKARTLGESITLEDNPAYFRKVIEPDLASLVDGVVQPIKDGTVSLYDFSSVALYVFEHRPTWDPTWGPATDVNKDGYVGIDDLMEVGAHFAESWPPGWYV
jgi:ABC-type transport system substrate-binding protein